MPNEKLGVLQIIGDLDRAGAQEVVRTLVEYLIMGNCRPVVCTLKDGPLRQDIEALGVKVEVLGPRQYAVTAFPQFVADLIRIRRQLVEIIKKYEIDVIQTHLLGIVDFLVMTLRYDTHARVVLWTIHNVNFLPKGQSRWMRVKQMSHSWLYWLVAHQISGFIGVSEQVSEAVHLQVGNLRDKVITINNGINVKRFEQPRNKMKLCRELGVDNNVYLALVVGRLHVQKGHCYLIEAASSVVSHYPNIHFLFAGEGELKTQLQTQAQEAGLAAHVHFLGNRSDIPDLLATIDLFILPSLWEGLSIALLEAMAAGKPIVATDVSGTKQVMIPGQTGLIVPPGNSSALAEAIIDMLSQPERAIAMGKVARRHVEQNYSAQKQAYEHLTLYRRLLNESGKTVAQQ